MSRGDMMTVFCYDVSEDKRRTRIAKLLVKEAMRVQYSVFEGRMSEARALSLSQRIAANLGDGDSLRVYVISASGEARTRVYGDGPALQKGESFWLA
jgi:CRISPR-associated protein Cas2